MNPGTHDKDGNVKMMIMILMVMIVMMMGIGQKEIGHITRDTFVSTYCDCPGTDHLVYTIRNSLLPLKNSLVQHMKNPIMI